MSNRQYILFLFIGSVIVLGLLTGTFSLIQGRQSGIQTESFSAQPVASTISADGTIRSENEATLNFQTGGKLMYLPFKEGDSVQQGQTIAQLDTYALQRQLTTALNNYRVTRNNFDQGQENSNASILQGQQKYAVNFQNANPVSGDLQNIVVNDIVKRVLDQNQANLDNSVISVELANYALQLATLTTPITGVVTHEDVTVPNINVTPLTSFSVADPNTPVFKANVSESDIDFVSIGAPATIQLNGLPGQPLQGTVTKIYPQKTTSPTGQQVYQVDIQSDALKIKGKLQQSGSILITSNRAQGVMLVPSWLVLSHNTLWVLENNMPVVKQVTVGKTHGNSIEILSGLTPEDKIIQNPESVVQKEYQML